MGILMCLITSQLVAAAATLTIVIDAGHGGHDYGAVVNGVSEKDVALSVAQRLRQELQQRCGGNVDVILTRERDEYVDLAERARIANNARADLMLSLHCNSLGEAAHHTSSAQAIDGAVLFIAPPPRLISDIPPADVMQASATFNAMRGNRLTAIEMARLLSRHLVTTAARKSCEVRQDNLLVLTAARVPAILIEMDYLTNDEQARWLAGDDGQRLLAKAISDAIIEHALNNGRKISLY